MSTENITVLVLTLIPNGQQGLRRKVHQRDPHIDFIFPDIDAETPKTSADIVFLNRFSNHKHYDRALKFYPRERVIVCRQGVSILADRVVEEAQKVRSMRSSAQPRGISGRR